MPKIATTFTTVVRYCVTSTLIVSGSKIMLTILRPAPAMTLNPKTTTKHAMPCAIGARWSTEPVLSHFKTWAWAMPKMPSMPIIGARKFTMPAQPLSKCLNMAMPKMPSTPIIKGKK